MAFYIGTYSNYSPSDLRDILIGQVPEGDTSELHNACIVLCSICADLYRLIDRLERKVAELEGE